jgi:uncharacterized protein DUF4383
MSLLGRARVRAGVLPCIPPGTDNDGRRADRRGLLLMLGVRSNGRPRACIPPRRAFVTGPPGGTPTLMTEQDAGQQGTRDRTGSHSADLGAGSARNGEESHPDAGARNQHDQEGRAAEGGPYVQAGRDEQGRPQPSVPHEGLLGRIASSVLAGQSVVLLVVAVAGYVVGSGDGFFGRSEATFLALRLNPAHSTILLITAVLGLAALARRKTLRGFALGQAVVYLILFAVGTAASAGTSDPSPLDLNTPDHILHGVLFVLGFITMMISSARIVEPPPGPDPYPDYEDDGASSDEQSGARQQG